MKSAVSPHKLLFFFENLSPSLIIRITDPPCGNEGGGGESLSG